jgi:hypothetical protein
MVILEGGMPGAGGETGMHANKRALVHKDLWTHMHVLPPSPSQQVVGKVSPWIDPDSPSPPFRRDSEAALRQELSWASHLSLQACMLPPPPRPMHAANYARIINQVRRPAPTQRVHRAQPSRID